MNDRDLEKGCKGGGDLTNELRSPEADAARFARLDKDHPAAGAPRRRCALIQSAQDGVRGMHGGALALDGAVFRQLFRQLFRPVLRPLANRRGAGGSPGFASLGPRAAVPVCGAQVALAGAPLRDAASARADTVVAR